MLKADKQIDFFLKNYPGTDYANDLKFKKDLIQNQLAAKELYIAKYYISVKKWIPAINRLKVIVNDFDKTIFVEEALHRLVEINYHLGFQKNPFKQQVYYYFHQRLSLEKMNKAAQILLEYEDFEAFAKTHSDVKTFLCNITQARWESSADGAIFTIAANRFLRNMVRAIVGTLLEVGTGKIAVEDLHKIIQSKNRVEAGFSVPASGLYLTEIKYPKNIYA